MYALQINNLNIPRRDAQYFFLTSLPMTPVTISGAIFEIWKPVSFQASAITVRVFYSIKILMPKLSQCCPFYFSTILNFEKVQYLNYD